MASLFNLLRPVAYASLPLIALQYSPHGRYYTRNVIYVGALGFVATLSAFLAAGLSLANRRFDVNYVVARTFYAVAGTLVGWRVEVEGEEWLEDTKDGGGRPAVLMCNHQSMIDILPLARCVSCHGAFPRISSPVVLELCRNGRPSCRKNRCSIPPSGHL